LNGDFAEIERRYDAPLATWKPIPDAVERDYFRVEAPISGQFAVSLAKLDFKSRFPRPTTQRWSPPCRNCVTWLRRAIRDMTRR
jgi:hypothetical protein